MHSASVTATNTCGSYSTFIYPSGGSYRVAKSSTIYPNIARESVNLALVEGINWDEVRKVQIVSASEGRVHYSSSIVSSNLIKENNKFNIASEKIPAGKYIVEVIYSDHRDSHHLIIE